AEKAGAVRRSRAALLEQEVSLGDDPEHAPLRAGDGKPRDPEVSEDARHLLERGLGLDGSNLLRHHVRDLHLFTSFAQNAATAAGRLPSPSSRAASACGEATLGKSSRRKISSESASSRTTPGPATTVSSSECERRIRSISS